MTHPPVHDPFPAGMLVLYEEANGLRQPQVGLLNASPEIEREVNDWIKEEPGLIVHRIDWLPSGGMLGASVLYSKGHRATGSLKIPPPRPAVARTIGDRPVDKLGSFFVVAGVIAGLVALFLFTLFYPATWNGRPGALMESELAVQLIVLTGGIGLVLIFTGIALVERTRLA